MKGCFALESLVVNYGGKPCYEILFEKDFNGLSDKVGELGFEGLARRWDRAGSR